MAKLWHIVTAEPVSSRWSALFGQCLCRNMCIRCVCGIPRKGIRFTRKNLLCRNAASTM